MNVFQQVENKVIENNTKIDILQERFDELTPEEKEEFKQVMFNKFNQIKDELKRTA